MSADAAVAELARDASISARSTEWREASPFSRRAGKVKTTSHRRPPARGAAPLDAANSARLSPRIFAGLVRTGEFALLSGLGFLLAYLYVAEFFRQYAAAMALAGLLSVAVFQALGLYTIPACANLHSRLTRLLTGWTVTVGALLATVFFLKLAPEFSRVWLALWYVGGAVGLLTYRAGVAAVTRRGLANGHLTRRAIVYGAGPASRSLIEALDSDPDCDIRVCGVFDDRGVARTGGSIAGYPNLGNLDALWTTAAAPASTCSSWRCRSAPRPACSSFSRSCGCCRSTSGWPRTPPGSSSRPRTYSFAGTVPLIDIIDKPITDWSVLAKWLFDMSVGLMALVGLAPVMALVALAVKLDSKGPVLFRQKRYGFNNELIDVYKFRSMYVDQADANASKLVTKGDPRVTRVGRFIRKTSLDELPQLFNVIKGELSLVGPRPHALQAKAADRLYHDVVDGYFARHKRQARHHRLGPDQRLARRDRHRGEDPEAGRARPLLHRQLVGAARPLHPPQDAVRAAARRERLLSPRSDDDARPPAAPAGAARHCAAAPRTSWPWPSCGWPLRRARWCSRSPRPVDVLTMGLIVLLPLIGLVAISRALLGLLAMMLRGGGLGVSRGDLRRRHRPGHDPHGVSLYLYLATFVFAAFVAKRPDAACAV